MSRYVLTPALPLCTCSSRAISLKHRDNKKHNILFLFASTLVFLLIFLKDTRVA